MDNKAEIASFQPENLHASLDAILSRQLTPETINTYASDALDALVELTERVTEGYNQQPTIAGQTQTGSEDMAFDYFKLGELEKSLDHVADLAESIYSIDEVIKGATVTSGVVVPPDYGEVNIRPGDGSFGEKISYNRLKTTLFILQQDFGIDTHNPEQLRLTVGSTEGTMRNTSYTLIEVPNLERSILVCDEEGNATYVFDSIKLAKYDPELKLIQLTKTDLNDLIEKTPEVGRRIVYSRYFISNLKEAMEGGVEEPSLGDQGVPAADTANYLKVIEKAPEGYLHVYGIHKKLGVNRDRIYNAIDEIGDRLGEVKEYKSSRQPTKYYSPAQVGLIDQYLKENNGYVGPMPEGYHTINSIRKELKLGNSNYVLGAIEALADELGEINSYTVAKACSPYQFGLIQEYIEQHTTAYAPEAPEDVMSKQEVAKKFNDITLSLVKVAIKEITNNPVLNEEIGPIGTYKFHNHPSHGLLPDQVSYLVQYIRQRGSLSRSSKLWHGSKLWDQRVSSSAEFGRQAD